MGRNLSKGSPPQSLSPGQKDLADTRETKNNKKWGCVGRGFWFSACDIFARVAPWARQRFSRWQDTHQPYRWAGGHSNVRGVRAHT